jgi:HAE1 family hydrophobic/amphiphilic exporter-1/multidrug efflux pump
MTRFFVERPIFSSVLAIVIVVLGLFALRSLPVAQYPEISPPTIVVSAVYPGATAEDVAQAVAAPIEQQIAGVNGVLYYASNSTSDGAMQLTITFEVGTDLDLAAVEVQNRVKLAEAGLPSEVTRNGVVTQKQSNDILGIVALRSDDPKYDATYLSNYAKLNVEDALKRIPGVGGASVFDQLELSMQLVLDPARMGKLDLTVADVAAAVREQNATNPAGTVGREPSPPGTQLTLPVTTEGRLTEREQFEAIILRSGRDGSVVRLRDVAQVVLGARDFSLQGRLNGKPTSLLLVKLRSGANALAVSAGVRKAMAELSLTFPKGIAWSMPYDTTRFIVASIHEVVHTFVEALILVFLVVFLFLQSWRATLIPALAVPVSIIGAFAGMSLVGFSVNTLTLFGLVLAIGIVVDDAIIVVESVERIMAEEHVSAREASIKAMQEVMSTLISVVFVLCAVFVPVAFVGGLTGQLYKQFAITIAVSVVLSGVVAVTLTPALCALLLKPGHGPPNRFFAAFNRNFAKLERAQERGTAAMLGRPAWGVLGYVVAVGALLLLFRIVPGSFVPPEDQGTILAAIELPDGASKERTDAVLARVEKYFGSLPTVADVVALNGLNLLTGGNAPNGATLFVTLKPWDERKKPQEHASAIVAAAYGEFAKIPEARVFAFSPPAIPGLGTTGGWQMQLQDRRLGDVKKLAALANGFVETLAKRPELAGENTTIRVNVPQVHVHVDRAKAKALGVSLADVFQTQQAFLSSLYVNDFSKFGRTYRVQLEAAPRYRARPEDIGTYAVRSANGEMVPLSAIVTTSFTSGPSAVARFNGFTSALVTGDASPGYSSGQALDAVEDAAKALASQGVGIEWSGQSFQEKRSGSATFLVFGMGLLMVFLVLAAQYESWAIPFVVVFGVPFSLLGALLAIFFRGLSNDVYFQIGLVTLIGLEAKNAILMVEFANAARQKGTPLFDAALQAAKLRFRPILMTSLAFILGVMPLALASGAGAASRNSIGTGVVGGMLLVTALGAFFIPLLFVLVRGFGERLRGAPRTAASASDRAA